MCFTGVKLYSIAAVLQSKKFMTEDEKSTELGKEECSSLSVALNWAGCLKDVVLLCESAFFFQLRVSFLLQGKSKNHTLILY